MPKILTEFLDNKIHTLITDGKLMNKINSNTDSHWINEKETDTKSLRIQYTPYNCLLKNANFQSKLPITK